VHADAGTRAYRFLRATAGPLVRAYFRVLVEGAHLVPRGDACIIAPNHQSYLDPIVVGATCPRPVHFMMVRAFWRRPAIGWASRHLGAFPVEEGRILPGTLRRALALLEAGSVVGVFPEGRISPDGRVGTGLPGIGHLALRAGVPIVPVGIAGTRRAFPKGRIVPLPLRVEVRYGEPVPATAAGQGARAAAELTRVVMERIATLAG